MSKLSFLLKASKTARVTKNLGFVSLGGAIGGFNAGPPGNRRKGATEGAIGALAIGGGFLFAKKHKNALARLAIKDATVIFRRVRGRIIPIFKKAI